MSNLSVNSITNAAGGNTATINGMTPTADSLQGFRNRIINGDMRIDQRNNGASVSVSGNYAEVFSVDRFSAVKNGAGVFTLQQSSGAPAGYTNSLLATVATADASIATDDFAFISQKIEGFNVADLGFGAAGASTITVSFWVRSNLTGTYAAVIVNGDGNRSYVTNYTINAANTWEQKTITVAGDTTGTWLKNNGAGLTIRFGLTAGSTFQQSAGSWGTANAMASSSNVNWLGTVGNNFYITGVQLEAGSVATPFERRPYGTELALCQRYYQLGGSGTGASGSTTNTQFVLTYATIMRATPSVSANGPLSITDGYTADYVQSSASASLVSGNERGAMVSVGNFSGLTANRIYFTRFANANAITFSAEL